MPRHPAVSPDGREVAFSYQGDLCIVASEGGEARRVTAHPAYEGHPIWSPDGRMLAFASDRDGNDDVYVLPLDGGDLRRLTFHSDGDLPLDWTADGRAVMFQSVRDVRDGGLPGLHLVSIEGGTPVLALPSGGQDAVISPDGRRVAYIRNWVSWWRRGYEGNARHQLWLFESDAPFDGGLSVRAPEKLELPSFATVLGFYREACLRPEGKFTCLSWPQAGSERPLGSNTATWPPQESGQPTLDEGMIASPQWMPDGRHLVYIAEHEGIANLVLLDTSDGRRAWVTRFKDGRLRYASLARNGSVAAFEYEDGISVVRIPSELPSLGSSSWKQAPSDPARLFIRLPRDAKQADLLRVDLTSGADEMAVSPDGKQIAFVIKGDLFAMKASKDEDFAQRLLDSPFREREISWSSDSKALYYTSDREGQSDIYRMTSADTSETRLARTLRFDVKRLTTGPEEERGAIVSPDGKLVAYRKGLGTLMLMDADGSKQKVVREGWSDVEYTWSPDSKWLAVGFDDDDFNHDLWIYAVDGSIGPYNVTRHPGEDFAPVWSPDGKILAWCSIRQLMRQTDVWYVRLTLADEEKSRLARLEDLASESASAEEPSPHGEELGLGTSIDATKKSSGGAGKKGGKGNKDDEDDAKGDSTKVEVKIDFDDLYRRVHRLTSLPGDETAVLVNKDGSEFFFSAANDGKRDLWKIKWDGTEPERVTKGGLAPTAIHWGSKHDKLFFIKTGGGLASIGTSGGDVTAYAFNADATIDRPARRAVVFEEGWRAMRDQFYDPKFHGADWQAAHDKYRPWASAASTQRDFQDVFRMMLGELNSSHQGFSGGPLDFESTAPAAATGELGCVFSARREGSGLEVVHVVPNSPAARVESKLAVGDRILAVDDHLLDARTDLARLLDQRIDQRVRLSVDGTDGKKREVVLRPISSSALRDLIYEEELKLRRASIAGISDRLAYVHIRSMDVPSVEAYERALYAEAHGKDALLIDVRDNGGGWTADYMLTSLTAPDHAVTRARGGGPGYPQDRRLLYAWSKPIVVLADENSFSNAEIFAWAIKTLDRGPVVGQKTAGGVISTGGTTLGDGSWIRLPFRGWTSRFDGSNEELTGCPPDVPVANLPSELGRGEDAQLRRAAEVALELLR